MTREINLPKEYLSRIVASIVDAVPTEAVYVFGSYARGEETRDSDLDLYVVTRDDDESRFTRAGRVGRALLWMGMPKDILLGSATRFAERRSNMADIEYVVAREGVKVYG
ncbi:nucleotidyltransferase domain-containing protein [uncultured Adlercreutzia sp.]|uniref:nucleotidyltransferase domain-containing protein n=1 Tax=uncultured Adlercreutzia sp. TaxID=875803 RepID=UPI0025E8A2D5|nr:nucleotidyltransferase domain-containing protein [uncultured Adlercreutzia sp.]